MVIVIAPLPWLLQSEKMQVVPISVTTAIPPWDPFFLKFLRSEFAELTLPSHFQLGTRVNVNFVLVIAFQYLCLVLWRICKFDTTPWASVFFAKEAEQKLIFQD